MNPEIETFFRNTSPWCTLDNKLTPIFNHIRTKKIHCLYQLHDDNSREEASLSPTSNRILPIFHTKMKKNSQEIDEQKKVYKARHQGQVKMSQRRRVQPISENVPTEKIMFVSPNSKIKKHLIDSIDYQGIESALFKKKDRISRFQDFCRTIRQKDLGYPRTTFQETYKEDDTTKNKTIDSSLGFRDTRHPFRITRKQFSPVTKKLEQIIKKHPLSRLSNY